MTAVKGQRHSPGIGLKAKALCPVSFTEGEAEASEESPPSTHAVDTCSGQLQPQRRRLEVRGCLSQWRVAIADDGDDKDGDNGDGGDREDQETTGRTTSSRVQLTPYVRAARRARRVGGGGEISMCGRPGRAEGELYPGKM